MTIGELFVQAGMAKSRGEIRRLVAQGAVFVDERKLTNADAPRIDFPAQVLLRVARRTVVAVE